ncbi:MAG: hypothetical protein ACM3PW_07010 [Chlamydiota bacterium]
MADARSTRSDRELQDSLIAYLADANLRRAPSGLLPLSPEQAQRAGRFARFLARRYYRDRLARSFRYSRRFGAAAETLADTPVFNAFLDDCVLGSVASAERVAGLAVNHVNRFPAPGPWWSDLLQYERLFFLQAATTENAVPSASPQPSLSARCHRFSWNLPELLLRLKSGVAVSAELRGEVTLLFSRTGLGRIYVVEVDAATAAVFHAASARLSPEQITEMTSLPAATVQQALAALAQVGALATLSRG